MAEEEVDEQAEKQEASAPRRSRLVATAPHLSAALAAARKPAPNAAIDTSHLEPGLGLVYSADF